MSIVMNTAREFAQVIAADRYPSMDKDVDMLTQIKALAATYQKRDPQPSFKDGIAFYAVGSNSSHQFHLGVKDGEVYRRAQTYDYYFDENGKEIVIDEDKVMKLPADANSFGYLGSH